MGNTKDSKPAVARLRSHDQRPQADIVIYDGQCAFCRAQVERLARWDSGGCLEFISLHDPLVAERFPDLTHEQMMTEMYVIDRRGNRFAGAAALRYLSRRLPRLWFLAPLLHLPFSLPLWQWCYRQIARRRYRLARSTECVNGSCRTRSGHAGLSSDSVSRQS